MQSRKASNPKKSSKNANEAVATQKSLAVETTPKPRASRSSQSKKEVSPKAPVTKSRRKAAVGVADIPASESTLLANTLPEPVGPPKTMAAAAGVESVFVETAVIDSVGVVAAHENGVRSHHSHEDVAKLAYSYWIARGYSHGLADEDWLRAEAELVGKR